MDNETQALREVAQIQQMKLIELRQEIAQLRFQLDLYHEHFEAQREAAAREVTCELAH